MKIGWPAEFGWRLDEGAGINGPHAPATVWSAGVFGDRAGVSFNTQIATGSSHLAAGEAPNSGALASNKHVVFIGVDGAQYHQILAMASAMLAGLDHLEGYAGGVEGTASQQSTVSGPGWSTLLTGVWDNKHGVTTNDKRPINAEVDSLFERINAADLGTIASIVAWADINKGHFAREMGRLEDPAVVDYVSTGLRDKQVAAEASELIGDAAPVFTFVDFNEPDNTGHAFGFGDAYTEALRTISSQIVRIWAAVAEREALHPGEEWMVIISTDHGRAGAGFSHGGQSDSERQIFIASNKEIDADGPVPQTSVAATILDFLGLSTAGIRGPSVLADDAIDTHAPILLAARVGDGSGDAAPDAPLTMILSEAVRIGQGEIILHRADDGSVVEAIDVTSDQVTIAGGMVTIQPTALEHATEYYVTVDMGAFVDLETEAPVRLFWEDFESLASTLEPYTSPTEVDDGDPTDWTAAPPDGWTAVDNSRPGGVTEFAGWTFHDKRSWIETAQDQGRSGFTNGYGVVAVADPDEYYDSGNLSDGKFRTVLMSPEIDLTDVDAGTATLTFDSSWWPDVPQEVRITVSYDGAAPIEVMHWSSKSGNANYHQGSPDETVVLDLHNPQGAESALLHFEMMRAGNDWWWAIDNIAVYGFGSAGDHGNAFAGIQDPHDWNFTTAAQSAGGMDDWFG
jgi:hypothetical protein